MGTWISVRMDILLLHHQLLQGTVDVVVVGYELPHRHKKHDFFEVWRDQRRVLRNLPAQKTLSIGKQHSSWKICKIWLSKCLEMKNYHFDLK